jgi:hypothetical protein
MRWAKTFTNLLSLRRTAVFRNCRRLSRAFIALVVTCTIATVGPLPGVRAETSYHRLKRKLHQFERDAGDALQNLGEFTLEAFSELNIDLVEVDDVELPSHSGKHEKAENARVPAKTPTHEKVKERIENVAPAKQK